MDFPDIHTDEELALLSPADQLEYAKALMVKAAELADLARNSFTVPAGPTGAAARMAQDHMANAINVFRHNLTLAGVTFG